MTSDEAAGPHGTGGGRALRRRAGHLYGLVITGSVLAAAPEGRMLGRVALAAVATLAVYWATESYAHWIAARAHLGRDLTGPERREVLADGLPLVAACGVPALVLVAEAVLGVEQRTGILLALVVNVGLLVGVGWAMATSGALRGWRRAGAATGTGLLGVLMIGLKLALH